MRDLAVNLTTLFHEYPLLGRPAAARAAGFERVEFWWPFGDDPTPSLDDVEAFVEAISSSGVTLVAMNLFAGDMSAGERGVLSYPEHVEAFFASVEVAMAIGERLGVRLFNAPYGHRRADLAAADQDAVATRSLVHAMTAAGRIDATILLEPVSAMPHYPLKLATDVTDVLDRVAAVTELDNLGFLFDQYHLMVNGEDVMKAAAEHATHIRHVQVADVPGRHEPGSGTADIGSVVRALRSHGYAGDVALEYFAEDSTEASLARAREAIERW